MDLYRFVFWNSAEDSYGPLWSSRVFWSLVFATWIGAVFLWSRKRSKRVPKIPRYLKAEVPKTGVHEIDLKIDFNRTEALRDVSRTLSSIYIDDGSGEIISLKRQRFFLRRTPFSINFDDFVGSLCSEGKNSKTVKDALLQTLSVGFAVTLVSTIFTQCPPNVFQPRWILRKQNDSLRVVMMGFVGEPVLKASNPLKKHTPVKVICTSDNILHVNKSNVLHVDWEVSFTSAVDSGELE